MRTILLFTLTLTLAVNAHASGYAVEELSDSPKEKPFSITSVESRPGELHLFIQSGNYAHIQRLIRDGSLTAQLSEGEDAVTVPLSFFKAVVCKDLGTFHLGYSEPLPDCKIAQVRHYLRTPVNLGHGRDLSIGLDPDFLWLIEEK